MDKDRRGIWFDIFKKHTANLINKNLSVLDIGCRDNYFDDKFKSLGFSWVGMDIAKGDGVSLKGRMEDIPLFDSSTAIIFSSHSFEHTTDPLKTLAEFSRVLRIRGLLIMITPYCCEAQILNMDKTHNFVLNDLQLVDLLNKSGFQIVDLYLDKTGEDDEREWVYVSVAVNVCKNG